MKKGGGGGATFGALTGRSAANAPPTIVVARIAASPSAFRYIEIPHPVCVTSDDTVPSHRLRGSLGEGSLKFRHRMRFPSAPARPPALCLWQMPAKPKWNIAILPVNRGKLRGLTAAPPMLLREKEFFSRH